MYCTLCSRLFIEATYIIRLQKENAFSERIGPQYHIVVMLLTMVKLLPANRPGAHCSACWWPCLCHGDSEVAFDDLLIRIKYSHLTAVPLKKQGMGWRNVSMVKSPYCSCKIPEFRVQHPFQAGHKCL